MTDIGSHSARSVLGADAPRQQRVGDSLPHSDVRHQQAHQWLIDESYLLNSHSYEAWLELLTDDIHYLMPVRVTTALNAGFETLRGMAHFDENKHSLSQRVARFLTEHAWTEDPPSRVRHYITNVRTFATEDAEHLVVESALLLFRSHGDVNPPGLLSAGREDLLRREGDSWKLARRTILADESVLRLQNLAIFL